MNTDSPLYSPDWYRLAPLRLRLVVAAGASRQSVRGEVWHVLSDPVAHEFHRFNQSAYRFITACDGDRTLDEVWQAQLQSEGDAAPTQAEAIRIIGQAYAAHLLTGAVAPDAAALVKRQARAIKKRRRGAANPLSFRVGLWDPDEFLNATVDLVRPLLGGAARTAAALLAVLGLLLLFINLDAFTRSMAQTLVSPRMALVMWLVYPVLKGLHELAHAYTVKYHGGAVHEIGVTLMMLAPVPYVDASAASAFADKHERIRVATAGILVEAVLAALAMMGWLLLEPGAARDVCLATVVVGLLSTLFVNGNPLMRFDGYHALCDAFELPNLATRSGRWWLALLKTHVLRVQHADFGATLRGETPWLALYAPLAWFWRVALLAALGVALSQFNTTLGLGLLAVALWYAAVKPLGAALNWAWKAPELAGQRGRTGALLAGTAALLLVGFFTLPVPERTQAPAIVWLPDESILRLHSDARVEAFLVVDGQAVTAGTPIARLSNEELLADLAQVRAALLAAEVERLQRFDNDAARMAHADEEITRHRAELARLQKQEAQLTLRAAHAGHAVIAQPELSLGRWFPQGHTLAHVLPPGAPLVRALVRNEDVALVRERPGVAAVQLAHDQGRSLEATVRSAIPQATTELPSAALGSTAGGPIAVDPAVSNGRSATEARFMVDLSLPEGVAAKVGTRALVTFVHGQSSLAQWFARAVRQAFLKHFAK